MVVTFEMNSAKLLAAFQKASNAPQQPAVRDALNQSGALYLGFIRRRFVELSRGGGEWPDLAESTKRSRMKRTKAGKRKLKAKGTAGGKFAILRDTSTLFNSLSTATPLPLPDGVRVGTAIKYAKYHQEGGRYLPKRKIIVHPDDATNRRINFILTAAVLKTLY